MLTISHTEREALEDAAVFAIRAYTPVDLERTLWESPDPSTQAMALPDVEPEHQECYQAALDLLDQFGWDDELAERESYPLAIEPNRLRLFIAQRRSEYEEAMVEQLAEANDRAEPHEHEEDRLMEWGVWNGDRFDLPRAPDGIRRPGELGDWYLGIRASVIEELDEREARGAVECREAVAEWLEIHATLSAVLTRLDEDGFEIEWLG